jgi:hypothetical protein
MHTLQSVRAKYFSDFGMRSQVTAPSPSMRSLNPKPRHIGSHRRHSDCRLKYPKSCCTHFKVQNLRCVPARSAAAYN